MAMQNSNLRGIIFMVMATGFFTCNDAFMKLATVGLPPFEVLFLRGVAGSLWALPVVLLTGNGPALRHVVDRWVVLRNLFELAGVLCYVVALAHMGIADVVALGQLAPMILLLGTAIVFRDRIGWARSVLIALGFAGAICVAQPGSNGISLFALLGLATAVGTALRDLTGRKVSPDIPSLVVAYGTLLLVMVGAGLATLVTEHWVPPDGQHLIFLACSGLLLSLGHFFIFQSYRSGRTSAVAPFYYSFAIWGVIVGMFVFDTIPNVLAFAGIGLIIASGVAVVLLDARRGEAAVEVPIA